MKSLSGKTYLSQYALVGGTALALYYGHRLSIDLVLFSPAAMDAEVMRGAILNDYENVRVIQQSRNGLSLTIEDIKLDILQYSYPIIFPVVETDGIRLLDKRDIAAMKFDTASRRGSKKDFYDIFYLLKEFSMEELRAFYAAKFQDATFFYVIRSLHYFENAESDTDPDPVSLENLSWEDVKIGIRKALSNYQF